MNPLIQSTYVKTDLREEGEKRASALLENRNINILTKMQ
jgi:hypothetical protein